MSRVTTRTVDAEPTWEIARLFPCQGGWSEDEYLALNTNQRIEFSDGYLEFPPMPTTSHQRLIFYLCKLLSAFVSAHDLGEALIAGVRVRLRPGKIREPDVVFMGKEHAARVGERFWKGADLVMEVVSGTKEDRERDLVEKRAEYARAGIREYWIVDPQEGRITVLRLRGKRYVVHGVFGKGETATSHLLHGFAVEVTHTLAKQAPPRSNKAARKPKRPAQE
jgi:Uma2 family endonuclease